MWFFGQDQPGAFQQLIAALFGARDTAQGHATAAANSATAAAGSATTASGHATAAQGYRNQAEGHRDAAEGYAAEAHEEADRAMLTLHASERYGGSGIDLALATVPGAVSTIEDNCVFDLYSGPDLYYGTNPAQPWSGTIRYNLDAGPGSSPMYRPEFVAFLQELVAPASTYVTVELRLRTAVLETDALVRVQAPGEPPDPVPLPSGVTLTEVEGPDGARLLAVSHLARGTARYLDITFSAQGNSGVIRLGSLAPKPYLRPPYLTYADAAAAYLPIRRSWKTLQSAPYTVLPGDAYYLLRASAAGQITLPNSSQLVGAEIVLVSARSTDDVVLLAGPNVTLRAPDGTTLRGYGRCVLTCVAANLWHVTGDLT